MKTFVQITLSFFLVTTFSACKKDKDGKDDTECDNSTAVGYQTIAQGTTTREYILHVPSTYNSSNKTPLLINFHGFGGCASQFSANVGNLNTVANSNNFLVAYPQGVTRTKGGAEWDPGDNGSKDISTNDAYFLELLINDISSEYNIDASKVYAAGYSNGGMMAYGLACTRPDIIAAAGIMSGIMLEGECDASEYTSIIHFHGTDDGVLPYNGNQDYQSVEDVVDFWLDYNNIPESSLTSTNLNGGDVVRDEYTGGEGNTAYTLYTVNGEHGKDGGHVWFTDDIDGKSPNQLLWDFLSSYSLDD